MGDIHAARLLAFKAAARYTSKVVPVLDYVGQLFPLLDCCTSLELAATTKALGLVTTARKVDAAYNLDLPRGVEMYRPPHLV